MENLFSQDKYNSVLVKYIIKMDVKSESDNSGAIILMLHT